MKTDELEISGAARPVAEVLDKTELIARYAGMTGEGAASMRLMAEELLSATRRIIDNYESCLWMETGEKTFELHMRITKPTDREDREKLIALSKAGKATPQKGLFSRLGAAVEDTLLDAAQAEGSEYRDYIMLPGTVEGASLVYTYRYLPQKAGCFVKPEAAVDELAGVEKTIIDSIVDDILVYSRSGSVEIAAIKKLG